MATPLKPSEFAQLVGLEPTDVREACKSGEQEYAGYPIGDWYAGGGSALRLNVPDRLVDAHSSGRGSGSTQRRDNPSGDTLPSNGMQVTEMAEAVDNNAAPVSANVSAAYAVGSMSDAVRENPEIMETIADVAVVLGAGGLALAATEDGESYRAAKVGGAAAGSFAAYKLIRHLCEQNDRATDMAEREQRHQIQQEKQENKSLPRERGDGAPAVDLNAGGRWKERQAR
jgi:hypothetical protein